jgi:hypothetical protein
MAGVTTTVALIAAGAAIAGAGVGAYSSIQQGNFAKAAAQQQASEMEIGLAVSQTQRAGEKVDEADQQLQRARQLDILFREQRVAAATSGLMGETFSAIQAGDLSAYTREQNLTSIYTSAKDSNAELQYDSLRRQIVSTRSAGNFAKRAGILNAASGIAQSAGSIGLGYSNLMPRSAPGTSPIPQPIPKSQLKSR